MMKKWIGLVSVVTLVAVVTNAEVTVGNQHIQRELSIEDGVLITTKT